MVADDVLEDIFAILRFLGTVGLIILVGRWLYRGLKWGLTRIAGTVRPVGGGLQHQVPDLELMLPDMVAGRPLLRWSVRGAIPLASMSSDDQVQALESDLEDAGFGIDDMQMAVAGRSDVEADPPYFVCAFRSGWMPADMHPPGWGIQHPDAGPWTRTTIGSKEVRVGSEALVDQTVHLRGRPYVYDVGEVRFVVTTDDEAWAADALARLHPEPPVETGRRSDPRPRARSPEARAAVAATHAARGARTRDELDADKARKLTFVSEEWDDGIAMIMAWVFTLAIALVTGIVLLVVFVVVGRPAWAAVAGTAIGMLGGAVLVPILFFGADHVLSRLVRLRADSRRVREAGRTTFYLITLAMFVLPATITVVTSILLS